MSLMEHVDKRDLKYCEIKMSLMAELARLAELGLWLERHEAMILAHLEKESYTCGLWNVEAKQALADFPKKT